MAYTKYKKSSGGKTGGWKSKKTMKTKKSSGKTATTKLKALVSAELQRVLSSGAQNERRKITMTLSLPDQGVYINGKKMFNNAIRIPITAALPAMAGAGGSPDVRRRGTNKVAVTGVSVRVSLSVSDETRLMLLAYEPHESIASCVTRPSVSLEPSVAAGRVPEKFTTRMVPAVDLGLVSKHGPFMVKKSGDHVALDTVDDSLFDARISTHAGKPIGPVLRKKFGGGGLRRTVNWDQSAADGVGYGYTHWTTHKVNEHFKLNKTYSYVYEGQNDPVFERSAEMLLVVDCPSLQSLQIPESAELVGARLRDVIVDVYYHDL